MEIPSVSGYIQGMATWDSGTQEYFCDKCGTRWRAEYKDYPYPDRGEHICDCGNLIHKWKWTRDFHTWSRIK